MESYISEAKALGYADEELRAYVQQRAKEDREERAAERAFKQAEREAREKKDSLEILRNCLRKHSLKI